MDENTTAALLPPLNDVRAPLIRFFFNLSAFMAGDTGGTALLATVLRTEGMGREEEGERIPSGHGRWGLPWTTMVTALEDRGELYSGKKREKARAGKADKGRPGPVVLTGGAVALGPKL